LCHCGFIDVGAMHYLKALAAMFAVPHD